jgi:hypothetical protein
MNVPYSGLSSKKGGFSLPPYASAVHGATKIRGMKILLPHITSIVVLLQDWLPRGSGTADSMVALSFAARIQTRGKIYC